MGMRKKGRTRTISRPRICATCITTCTLHRIDARSLKPHVACCLPRVDICTLRHLGHVKLDRAKVRNRCGGRKAESVTCSDGCSAARAFHLVAPHIWAADVGYTRIALVVLGLADCSPIFTFGLPIYDDAGETI